jgi:hypothetical protein
MRLAIFPISTGRKLVAIFKDDGFHAWVRKYKPRAATRSKAWTGKERIQLSELRGCTDQDDDLVDAVKRDWKPSDLEFGRVDNWEVVRA